MYLKFGRYKTICNWKGVVSCYTVVVKAVKISIIVQATHEAVVREALNRAGAGKIGNYKNCQFITKGEAQFEPEENASPVLGERSQLETVAAVQIQTWCLEEHVEALVKLIKEAHPNEEPAIELMQFEIR